MSEAKSPKTTIRADTGERHQRKYASRNPVQIYVLERFVAAAAREINRLSPSSILEFGTGEGFFLNRYEVTSLVMKIIAVTIAVIMLALIAVADSSPSTITVSTTSSKFVKTCTNPPRNTNIIANAAM